jgi:hypothetical protein
MGFDLRLLAAGGRGGELGLWRGDETIPRFLLGRGEGLAAAVVVRGSDLNCVPLSASSKDGSDVGFDLWLLGAGGKEGELKLRRGDETTPRFLLGRGEGLAVAIVVQGSGLNCVPLPASSKDGSGGGLDSRLLAAGGR